MGAALPKARPVLRGLWGASAFPPDDAAALVAGGELGGLAADERFDLAGNLEVAATAFAVVRGDAGGETLRGDAVVQAQCRLGRGGAGGLKCGFGLAELGAEDTVAVAQVAQSLFVAGDVLFQDGLGGGEFLFRLVDRVHDGELLLFKSFDLLHEALDFGADGSVLVVFAHFELLGAVFGGLLLGGGDLAFDELFLGFQLLELGAGRLDGSFYGRDFGFGGGDVLRVGLDLLVEVAAAAVSVLQDQQRGEGWGLHAASGLNGGPHGTSLNVVHLVGTACGELVERVAAKFVFQFRADFAPDLLDAARGLAFGVGV